MMVSRAFLVGSQGQEEHGPLPIRWRSRQRAAWKAGPWSRLALFSMVLATSFNSCCTLSRRERARRWAAAFDLTWPRTPDGAKWLRRLSPAAGRILIRRRSQVYTQQPYSVL